MPYNIERVSRFVDQFVATNSAATSPKIGLASSAGGVFFVESLSGSPTTINWHVARSLTDAAPAQLYNSLNTAVTTTISATGRCYPLPDELFGAQIIVAVTNTGTATLTISIKG